MKILLVDDSKFSRTILKGILSKNYDNIIFREADNGEMGIKEYKIFNPNIVIMDIVMDGINGIEATKEIYRYDKNCNIIICSSIGSKFMVNDALSNGAKFYVIKPIDVRDFISKINKIK